MKLSNIISMVLIMITTGLTISTFYKGQPQEPAPKPQEKTPAVIVDDTPMRVHFIDVGQGDCQLVETDGEFMLIDCGERDYSQKVLTYLKEHNVTRLKYVIATHPHSDHIGGMADIISNMEIDNFFMPDKAHTTKTFENMLYAIQKKGLEITIPQVGDVYSLGEGDFEFISPYEDDDNLNNVSLGIKLRHGIVSFVMCGDVEEKVEKEIIRKDISCNVLKLNHHGSSTSNSEEFLNATNPDMVVICCGKDNSYGHPHKEVLERLKQTNPKIFRTDEMGDIVFESDGTKLSWQTSKGDI